MEATQTQKIAEGGDRDMQTELLGINVGDGLEVKERYVGPGAWWIAQRLSLPVRFERDWFWTEATCHVGEKGDRLAFRQRPDGNGIDARCLDGGCSPVVAVDALGSQARWLLRGPAAYEPLVQPEDRFRWLTDWPRWKIALYGAAALSVAVPLLLGYGLVAAYLNYVGFSAGAWLMAKLISQPRRRRHRR